MTGENDFMNQHESRQATFRTVAFWSLQAVLIGSTFVWVIQRQAGLHAHLGLPAAFQMDSAFRNTVSPFVQQSEPQQTKWIRIDPLRIEPQYDRPAVVSSEQLVAVLHQLKPRLRGPQPKINHVDHALRFWGVEAVFDDPDCLSGVEMRELLLDHRRFREAWGPDEEPFLIPDTRGIRVRIMDGDSTASHVDHTLAGLAEVGTPLDYPVMTPDGEKPLQMILEQSLREFSLNQQEYEWSTLAYALYLPHANKWRSSEGQEITFDRLADRIMRQRLAQGVCRGNHRLHALVMLLRVNDQQKILSGQGRQRVTEYLQDVTRRLVKSQSAEGYWDHTWPGIEREGEPSDRSSDFAPQADQILVTGHVLEWWSLSPPEILPEDQVIERAGQWLTTTITQLTPAQVRKQYTFLSHAGRALSLWRGKFPAAALRETRSR